MILTDVKSEHDFPESVPDECSGRTYFRGNPVRTVGKLEIIPCEVIFSTTFI